MRSFGFGLGGSRPIPIPLFGSGGGDGYVDPVPDWLFAYRDFTESALTPINSPSTVTGLGRPDTQAASFNGVDQRYSSSDLGLTAVGTGAFTILARMKTSVTSQQVILATGTGSSSDQFRFRMNNTGQLQFRTSNNNKSSSGANLANGVWRHVAIRSEGSGSAGAIFIDGSKSTNVTMQTYNFTGTGFLQVGASNEVQPFNGELDDIFFYDRALTDSEILAKADDKV